MNPLDAETLKFELIFNNEDSFGNLVITEPVKFDGAAYVVKQRDKADGRDVSYMNESIDLYFYKGDYDVAENPLMLPDGTIVYNLTQGFEQLLECRRITGFETDVSLKVTKGGVGFIMGSLDFHGSETDELTFISCKAEEETAKQIIKRREDLVVDLFSDEDIDGEYIEPLQTTDILLKAKPIVQESEWKFSLDYYEYTFTDSNLGNPHNLNQNPVNNILKPDIDGTLSFLNRTLTTYSGDPNFINKVYDFGYVDAQEDLSEVVIDLSDFLFSYYVNLSESINDEWATPYNAIEVRWYIIPTGSTDNSFLEQGNRFYKNPSSTANVTPYEITYIGEESIDRFDGFTGNANRYDIRIPDGQIEIGFIPRDHRLCVVFNMGRNKTIVEWKSANISVKVTSTALDSVIKGVRYVDILKQTTKSISGFDVYAPRFDVGGEYYEQFAVTGNLIKRRDDLPFPLKYKDAFATLQEVHCDYQIIDDKVYVGNYGDFYPNHEIGVFESFPDDSAVLIFNQKFAINQFEYGYKTYEQNKDEENTLDEVHTESQWSEPNRKVENTKKISLTQIRGAFKIEFLRKEAIKTTTSTTDDDKLILLDVVSIAPNTRREYSVRLQHNINADGNLQLLTESTYSWGTLGFAVGSEFILVNTGNAGTYQVVEYTDSILTLSGSPTFTSTGVITTINYPLTGVAYTNRTNEGFELIEGVLNPDKFSNLRYTIKRNMKTWYSYLATCSKYVQDLVFRNTYFKNNGDLETRYEGETESVIENANINTIDFGEGILTPNIYKIRLVVPFEDAVNIINAIKTINDDDTIGGFIRTKTNTGRVLKGYFQELEYEPGTETLTATLEERNEGEFVSITTEGDSVLINEVGYDLQTDISKAYDISNDYLVLYDINNVEIINPTRYDKVSVNGEFFDTSILLAQKLIEIL